MLFPMLLLAPLLGCSSSSTETSSLEKHPMNKETAVLARKPEITVPCTLAEQGGATVVAIRATNTSLDTLHVLDGTNDTAPYVRMSDQTVEILFGVHLPPEDVDLFMVRIPTTRPLAPGETIAHTVQVRPLIFHDHYLGGGAPPVAHDARSVGCRVRYGRSALEMVDHHTRSINEVLDWQEWAPDVMLTLPPA